MSDSPQASDHRRLVVDALRGAGLEPPAEDLDELIARYPGLRALLDGIDRIESSDVPPELIFDPSRP